MIPDILLRHYLYDQCRINVVQFALTASWTQVLPGNPDRFAVAINSSGTTTTYVAFSDMTKPDPYVQFGLHQENWNGILTFDQLGSLIHRPLLAVNDFAGTQCAFIELSIAPDRAIVMRRLINEYLSQFQSP